MVKNKNGLEMIFKQVEVINFFNSTFFDQKKEPFLEKYTDFSSPVSFQMPIF